MNEILLHSIKCCEAWVAGKGNDDPLCPRCRLNDAAPKLLEACKRLLLARRKAVCSTQEWDDSGKFAQAAIAETTKE